MLSIQSVLFWVKWQCYYYTHLHDNFYLLLSICKIHDLSIFFLLPSSYTKMLKNKCFDCTACLFIAARGKEGKLSNGRLTRQCNNYELNRLGWAWIGQVYHSGGLHSGASRKIPFPSHFLVKFCCGGWESGVAWLPPKGFSPLLPLQYVQYNVTVVFYFSVSMKSLKSHRWYVRAG